MPKLEERNDAAQEWLEKKKSEPVRKSDSPAVIEPGWWDRKLKPGFAPWEPNCFEFGGELLTVAGVVQKPARVFHEVPDAEFQHMQRCARFVAAYAEERDVSAEVIVRDF